MANFRTPKIVGLLVPENFGADAAVPPGLGLCDLLELRFDLFRGAKPGELVSRARAAFPGKPLLFTVRLERDGGAWPDGDAGARFPLFAEALEAGADWADAELDEPGLVRRLRPVLARTGSKLLVSNHLWSAPESVEACEALWRSALRLEGDGVKLVWKMDDRAAEGILTEFLLRASSGVRPAAIPSAMSFLRLAAMALSSSSSSRSMTILTASSMRSMRFGKVSLNSPVMLTVTSTRGLPSSLTGITSIPRTCPPVLLHTGFTPMSQRM